ncbi:MAG TPA: hypothetical protein VFD36_20620 [Kofleriaceae bacterium]|nr:hypothetical protein [Kofleriaceae bacterium]
MNTTKRNTLPPLLNALWAATFATQRMRRDCSIDAAMGVADEEVEIVEALFAQCAVAERAHEATAKHHAARHYSGEFWQCTCGFRSAGKTQKDHRELVEIHLMHVGASLDCLDSTKDH